MFLDLMFQSASTPIINFLASSDNWSENLRFLSVKLINPGDFAELLFRFSFNTVMMLMIVYCVYLRYSERRNYTFSFLAVGSTVFLLCYLLSNVKLELGFALGLFAIFGIIRYRTDAIPFKQMTYLFVVIGMAVMNALTNKKISYAELLFTNLAIIFGLWLLERYLSRRQEGSIKIIYENITNVNQGRYDVLMDDLKERTGFDVTHFEVEKIDYLKDTADIRIFFTIGDNSCTLDDDQSK